MNKSVINAAYRSAIILPTSRGSYYYTISTSS